MEIFLRIIGVIIKLVYLLIYPLLQVLLPRKRGYVIPPIKNKLLTLSLVSVIKEFRERRLKSQDLVAAYLERIREVEPFLNAVVEDRFEDALKEAKHADDLIAKCNTEMQLQALFIRYPLLGAPFTVKEACGLKGMSHIVGSLQRIGKRCTENGKAVELLRAAGGIPLLVSANPEYCFSIETNTFTNGICKNPYDDRRTPGGSSGGEGALNGAGASLFGIGSDIAGSIRVPSLFNGIFGHKPTGGLISVQGHFPGSSDLDYDNYLQLGPITRFGCDLALLTEILAGKRAEKLDLMTPVNPKNIKIYYSLGFSGLNGLLHPSVDYDIQLSIVKAAQYFKQMGLTVAPANIKGFKNSIEIALSAIVRITDFPFLMNTQNPSKTRETLWEYVRSVCGKSTHTKDGLMFELMRRTNTFMPAQHLIKYKEEAVCLKNEIIELLGNDGVLFFPTFIRPAVHHNSSHLALWGIDYPLIFNVLGLPATHIPMGLNDAGLPIGFQVVAASYMDKLCFQIAGEMEQVFGGWVPPS